MKVFLFYEMSDWWREQIDSPFIKNAWPSKCIINISTWAACQRHAWYVCVI